MAVALFTLIALLLPDLPSGPSPDPVPFPHFPDAMHALIWRNWQLVPAQRMARTIGARTEDVLNIGHAMGLDGPPKITPDQQRRSYITVIRRNWHLLPYDQLLTLLGWSEVKLAYTLREDDFLYVKLGNLKPKCSPIRFAEPNESARQREREIAEIVRREFPNGASIPKEPLFDFVRQLSAPLKENTVSRTSSSTSATKSPDHPVTQTSTHPHTHTPKHVAPNPHPRFCYSYFALYGDPLLDKEAEPYPDGYLARLAKVGVNGVWLQGVLYKLSPFPWDPKLSEHYKERLANLSALVKRAKLHGIDVYLYLNEPRAMPSKFFQDHSDFKGAPEGDFAAMCTSNPQVQEYIASSVASICKAVPELGGFFTITASENLTNCWSHNNGNSCPRCAKRAPSEVISEVNSLIDKGIKRAGARTRLIAWDWGWADSWAADVINRLPRDCWLQSVSEWDMPIERGGIKSRVGEYSLSSIGPGPRAARHWELARKRGLKTIAKVQAANSWELSAVPYIPAVQNSAEHAARLRLAGIDGVMLGWTLGGYPSPNLAVFNKSGEEPLRQLAVEKFGPELGVAVCLAWQNMSSAFAEFPFEIGTVYSAPLQMGPANLLWEQPTGYRATMVGIPYDDLNAWRSIYPPGIFADQLTKASSRFSLAVQSLRSNRDKITMSDSARSNLNRDIDVANACAIHFRSVANQTRFVLARDILNRAKNQNGRPALEIEQAKDRYEEALLGEIILAKRLHEIQNRDSRIGFEATNQYYYVPLDLVEKVINCQYLLHRFRPD